MIVQCPSCTSRYRIRDANIPPSGGKIRCPSCSHSFIVYPEAAPEEDKTSITGSNEIAALLGGEGGNDDDGKTEIVQGDALDKMRALEALKNEMGSALEGDGTVEMQNPLDMWKAAQAATKAAAEAEEDESVAEYGDSTLDHDDYDIAKTEIVSPDALNIPIPAMSDKSGQADVPKPGLPKPNIPRPSISKPGASVPTPPPPSNEVWQDPDATIDAGFHVETASMKAPDSVPEARQDEPVQPGPPSPPPRAQTPPPQPPRNEAPPQPVTQEDSGPNAPTTDPFALPESDPFANAGSSPSAQPQPPAQQPPAQQPPVQQPSDPQDAPQVPVGSQANDPFANAQPNAGAPVEPAGGPDPRHQGPWKLKTNFGLTYEFPDNKSLRSWMSSREELDGHTLSADGENFYAINEFPQLHRSPSMVSQQIPSYSAPDSQERPPSGGYTQQPAPMAQQPGPGDSGLNAPPMGAPSPQGPGAPPAAGSGPMPQTSSPGFTSPDQFGSGQRNSMPGNSGLGGADAPGFGQQQPQQPAPTPAPVRNEYVPPSQSSAWDKILWVVLLVLMMAAGLIAVQTFEIFDVVGEARKILGMPAKVEQTQVDPSANSGAATPEATPVVEQSDEEQAQLAEKLMRDARRFKKKNKLADSLRKLETIEQIDDTNIEIYEMRAEIYDELGQADEAEAARARISELTPASDDADAGAPDAS